MKEPYCASREYGSGLLNCPLMAPSAPPGVAAEPRRPLPYCSARFIPTRGWSASAPPMAAWRRQSRSTASLRRICWGMIRDAEILGAPAYGMEIPLWDLLGKAAGMPLSRIWGGAEDRVRAYSSTGE